MTTLSFTVEVYGDAPSRGRSSPRRKQDVRATIDRAGLGAGAHFLVKKSRPLRGIGFEFAQEFWFAQ